MPRLSRIISESSSDSSSDSEHLSDSSNHSSDSESDTESNFHPTLISVNHSQPTRSQAVLKGSYNNIEKINIKMYSVVI
jgi:hypothetical protein